MKSTWSRSWVRSVQPRKQRKYIYNAPAHILKKLMGAPLTKELRKQYGKRNLAIIVGDTIKITTGQFKGTIGKVERVNVQKQRLFVAGAEQVKSNGQSAQYPIHPSNVMIVTPKLDDKKRKGALNRK